MTALPVPDDGEPIFVGVGAEITDRRKAEQALRDSEGRFRSIFNGAGTCIALADADGIIVEVNQAFCEMLDCPQEEFVGTYFGKLTHPEDIERELVFVGKLIAGEQDSYRMEKRYVHKSGRLIWCDVVVTVLRDDNGHPTSLVVVATDLTQRREAEQMAAEKTQALERSNQDLEQFAYAVSHDLQEPLRMVSGFLTLLHGRYGGQFGEDADEFIGFAVDGAQRMSRMISDLLEYSRITTRGANPAPVDLGAVLDDALANLQTAVKTSRATVTRPEVLPMISADCGQVVRPAAESDRQRAQVRKAGPTAGKSACRPGGTEDSGRCRWRTTASAFRPSTRSGCSACSNACTDATSTKAPASAWPCASESSNGMAAAIRVDSDGEAGSTFVFTLPAA